jgi:hypothetical protein
MGLQTTGSNMQELFHNSYDIIDCYGQIDHPSRSESAMRLFVVTVAREDLAGVADAEARAAVALSLADVLGIEPGRAGLLLSVAEVHTAEAREVAELVESTSTPRGGR